MFRYTPGSTGRVPEIQEVIDFGFEIGVPSEWMNKFGGYCHQNTWGNLLHDIGHYAVKPDGYYPLGHPRDLNFDVPDFWRSFAGKWEYPNCSKYSRVSCTGIPDPTPDEWGVRAWCLQVLEVFQWVNPIDAGALGYSRNNHQWNWQTTKCPPSLRGDGSQQLERVGINVLSGAFRPAIGADELIQSGEDFLQEVGYADFYFFDPRVRDLGWTRQERLFKKELKPKQASGLDDRWAFWDFGRYAPHISRILAVS
jgi:hypothetical protein